MINVRLASKIAVYDLPEVRAAVQEAEQQLAGSGRILLRPSGTEPVVRVMVEGADSKQVHRLAQDIATVVKKAVS
jgi:phosphoglucosamine mutase